MIPSSGGNLPPDPHPIVTIPNPQEHPVQSSSSLRQNTVTAGTQFQTGVANPPNITKNHPSAPNDLDPKASNQPPHPNVLDAKSPGHKEITLKSRLKSASPGNPKNADEDLLVSPASKPFKKTSRKDRNRGPLSAIRVSDVLPEVGTVTPKGRIASPAVELGFDSASISHRQTLSVDSGICPGNSPPNLVNCANLDCSRAVSGISQSFLPNSAISDPNTAMEVDARNQKTQKEKPPNNPSTPSKSLCTVNRSATEIPTPTKNSNFVGEEFATVESMWVTDDEDSDDSDEETTTQYANLKPIGDPSVANSDLHHCEIVHPHPNPKTALIPSPHTDQLLPAASIQLSTNPTNTLNPTPINIQHQLETETIQKSAQHQTAPIQNLQTPPTQKPTEPVNKVTGPPSPVHPSQNAWKSTTNTYLSIADRIKQNQSSNRIKIAYYPPVVTADGKRRVVITNDDLVKAAKAYPLHLYGYFLGTSMDYLRVNYCLKRDWRKFGITEVTKSPAGYYYFKFSSEEGMKGVLEGGPWFVNNIPLFVKKWEPGMCLAKVEPAVVPLWVTAHDVPLGLWTDSGICKVMSYAGKPLLMDKVTEQRCTEFSGRIGYARMLVDVLASSNLPDEVEVEFPLTEYQQPKVAKIQLSYHWKPPLCPHCCVFGHNAKQCKKNPQPTAEISPPPPSAHQEVPTGSGIKQNTPSEGFTVVERRNKSQKRHSTGQVVATGNIQPNVRKDTNQSRNQKGNIGTSSNPIVQEKMNQMYTSFELKSAQKDSPATAQPSSKTTHKKQPPPHPCIHR